MRADKLGEVAAEFDRVHTVERALRVGSIDAIIPAARLRPHLIEALERGMRRTLERPMQEAEPSRPLLADPAIGRPASGTSAPGNTTKA